MDKETIVQPGYYFVLICNRRECCQICTALACPQNAWGKVFSVRSLRKAAIEAVNQHERENPGHKVRIEVRKASGKTLAEEEKDEQCSSV